MTQDNLSFLSDNPFYGVYYSGEGSSLQIERIPVPTYDNKDVLQDYLMHNSSPFSVRDLKSIGLADIVGEINKRESSMSSKGKWDSLGEEETIELPDLQQRILDLQFDTFLKHYASKYIYSTRTERFARSLLRSLSTQLEAFDKIKQVFITKLEDNSYINIEEQNTPHELRCKINFDGRVWIQLCGNLSNRILLYEVQSQYDLPPYSINVNSVEKLFSIYCRFDKDKSKSSLTLSEVTDIIFEKPVDIKEHKTAIQNIFPVFFNEIISLEEIVYDPVRKCYCLSKEKEQQLFAELIPQESECKQFAKYTSFSTLMATLQSGKIRMNSIAAMNDKTEMFYLSDSVKNFQESIAEEGDNLYLANRNFITSFSNRIDELDMWRFYGDNAHGVCMVFEPKENSETGIREVLYINKEENEKIIQMKKILSQLKDDKIDFRFPILDRYKPFYKSEDFKNEAEHRLLIVSDKHTNWIIAQPYNILSPYVEKDLGIGVQDGNTDFPLVLKKIILGPEMLNKETNKIQLNQFLMNRYSNYNIEICKSTISTYR